MLRDQFNPRVDEALARTAEVLSDEVDYLSIEADKLLESSLASRETWGDEGLTRVALSRSILGQAHPALQRRALRLVMAQISGTALTHGSIEETMQLIGSSDGKQGSSHSLTTSSLPGGMAAWVEGDWIVIANTQLPGPV